MYKENQGKGNTRCTYQQIIAMSKKLSDNKLLFEPMKN